jgi:hypothetical protein
MYLYKFDILHTSVLAFFTMTPEIFKVTAQEVTSIIKTIKNKKSTGYDEIPMKLIKDSVKPIAGPLAHIINLTLQNGIFPDGLKKH